MLADKPLIAFALTTDQERARSFYVDTLGLRLTHADHFALVIDAGGTMLRVSTTEQFTPSGATILGWKVADIQTEMAALAARGVTFERYPYFEQDEAGVWTTADGTKVAWFKDPDGNTLSLGQYVE